MTLDELRAELDDYERRFGFPSDEMYEAVADGRLREDSEFRSWSTLYRTYRDVLEARKRRTEVPLEA